MWSASGITNYQSYCTQIEDNAVMDYAFPSDTSPPNVVDQDEFDHHTIDFDVGLPDTNTHDEKFTPIN
jgi:hypothetical protein